MPQDRDVWDVVTTKIPEPAACGDPRTRARGIPPAELARFDEKLTRLMRERQAEPIAVPHRVWCVVAERQ